MCDKYMQEAITEAKKAARAGDVPVGAVIVKDDKIIGRGHNETELRRDPTAHGEMIAIREAAGELGYARLTDCRMYVTIEPCPMCAGAIIQARIPELFIGAPDPKAGAAGSVYNILQDGRLNHRVQVTRHVMEAQCSEIISEFFRNIREKK